MSANFDENYPALLADLVVLAGDVLQKRGLSKDEAQRVAFELSERVRTAWGGHLIYLPKGDRWESMQRDLEIFAKFKGNNHAELASQYQLCEPQIYKIIARCRANDVKRRQIDAFGEPDVGPSSKTR